METLSIVDPDQQFDVTQFVTKCDKLVQEIHGRGKLPIIVGKGIIRFYLRCDNL